MQCAPYLGLPRKAVDELIKLHRDLDLGQRFALVVEELQVRDETERIGHRDDAILHFDPVPSHARGLLGGSVTPERLPAARRVLVSIAQDPCAQVLQLQLRGTAGLPQ